MLSVPLLRAFVTQRLTLAADDIIQMFERTIASYEEEIDRQRSLLGAEQPVDIKMISHNQTALPQDVQQQTVDKDKVLKQLDCSSSLEQGDIQLLHIKEEQEDLWTNQVQEHLQSLDETVMNDLYENTESSQIQLQTETTALDPGSKNSNEYMQDEKGEGFRKSEPAFDTDVVGFLKAAPEGGLFLPRCFNTETKEIEDSGKKTAAQSSLDTQKDNEPVSHKHKLFKCAVCGRVFTQNGPLQRHVTCHTGEKPFECTECGKTFRQKGTLKKHIRSHTGEKPFGCLICGKHYTQNGSLVAHMRLHTGEKPFSCSVCKKRYNERGTLVRHMRVHTGEKPFTCTVCGKSFSEKGNLNKHRRIHTREKPFSCGVCGKKCSLYSHVRSHKCSGNNNGT
ncbi:zinc finger and SCAN domain-containing protein 2-like [Thalassophryne amazonica]|uniref:zinc finger and SCAN domain-containing protein 2-like n=1 Tax=Thalassophryne amazonica TaxID=390379 RepID=UPI001471BE98|nr:zinc finger and SCAN domain-containing protein 2-like [Thalassophryne amazonica]